MGRSVTLGNGRDIDKDIELCRTTNEKTRENPCSDGESYSVYQELDQYSFFSSQEISWCKSDLCDQHQS